MHHSKSVYEYLGSTSNEFPDTNTTVWINVGVEKLRLEPHLGGVEGVVLREGEGGDEDSVLEICSLWSRDGSFPLEKVVLSDGSSSNAWGYLGENSSD